MSNTDSNEVRLQSAIARSRANPSDEADEQVADELMRLLIAGKIDKIQVAGETPSTLWEFGLHMLLMTGFGAAAGWGIITAINWLFGVAGSSTLYIAFAAVIGASKMLQKWVTEGWFDWLTKTEKVGATFIAVLILAAVISLAVMAM